MWLILWIFLTIISIVLIGGFLSVIFIMVDLWLFDGEISELIQDRAKEWLHKKLDKE